MRRRSRRDRTRGRSRGPSACAPSAWWLGLAAFPLLALAAWRFRRRSRSTVPVASGAIAVDPIEPATNAERLADVAERVREALGRCFVAVHVAMSTEEMLATLHGDGSAHEFPRAEVTQILAAADRAKFARAEVSDAHLAAAEGWAAVVLAAAADGARSTINGK